MKKKIKKKNTNKTHKPHNEYRMQAHLMRAVARNSSFWRLSFAYIWRAIYFLRTMCWSTSTQMFVGAFIKQRHIRRETCINARLHIHIFMHICLSMFRNIQVSYLFPFFSTVILYLIQQFHWKKLSTLNLSARAIPTDGKSQKTNRPHKHTHENVEILKKLLFLHKNKLFCCTCLAHALVSRVLVLGRKYRLDSEGNN